MIDYLVSMRYGLTELTIKAVEDFLRGPEVLQDGGAEVVAVVRKLWSEHPETTNHPAWAVPGIPAVAMPRTPAGNWPSMLPRVLVKQIVRQLLRRPQGIAAVPIADAHWWHVALFEAAVVTDSSQESVRVRRFDRDMMVDLGRRAARVLWRLSREGEQVRDAWRAELPRLSSRETWERLYELR
jgi:galactofuranosylgalactofuranosylrhamnosyl-N-acetylglucosaminyl-diphospho-decaprenol beta-1,5/1,6-galactofuranosyltransferase